ncbi:MAG TPA: sugar transferase, partial [Roseimicrobium sp.]|nr:sugar transferase [Roseimicrobium sp.]
GSFVIESSRQVICYLPGNFHHREHLILKRLVDLLVAVPTVLLILPFAAIVVKLFQLFQSPGPLFFRQERSGASGESFEILKFRSMHVRKVTDSPSPDDKTSRVYAFGAWLRKHSMDELPQFWNVVKGDLSVVGPRPHLAVHDTQFVAKYPAYVRRFRVKPGITGLAQVRGHRGAVLTEEDIKLRAIADLAYIDRWSVMLDLIIIAKTALQVFRPPNSAR